MILAIVGSRDLEGSIESVELIFTLLDKHNPSVLVSGGAVGVDQQAALAARVRGIEVIEYLPIKPTWYYYKKRDKLIAEKCTFLIRIARKTTKSKGSLWTLNYAQSLNIPTEEYLLD